MGGLTRSARNIRWIETYCVVPEGAHVAKPVKLRPWQKAELKKIYDNPAGTRQAIISFPRKNGKTALISFLLLLHLCGPEAKMNSQLYSAAQSRDQAATIYKLAAKIVRMSPDLNDVVILRDTAKEMVCPEIGTFYAALSADKSTAHGKSPVFAVHDELGQVKGPVSDLYDAVETGMGAHDAPLSVVISTQAPTDDDLLSRLIDGAGEDPRTVVSVHSAPMDADPFDEATLKGCNPAWGDFLNAGEVLRTRDVAKAMPSQEASFRNLHLNQRIEVNNPFISRAVWEACGAEPGPLDDLPIYAGLDLSESRDLTAFVPVGVDGDEFAVDPVFWLPEDGLSAKAHEDRVPYDVWRDQGFLRTAPGATVDYAYVSHFLVDFIRRHNVVKIAFDRWNFRHLKPWLLQAGLSEAEIENLFEPMGQGFQSMSPALRDLEGAILNKRLRHGKHPVLSMCAANAIVQSDPAGNRKLTKAKSRGRIDGMIALAMAMSAAVAGESEVEPPTPWDADPDFRLVV